MKAPANSRAGGFAMGPAEWGLLLLLSVLWGGTFNLIQLALRELPPFTLVCLRMIITTVALAAVAVALGHSLAQPWRVWRSFAIMGLVNSLIPHSLNAWGQTQITSGLAAVLNASTPMFTVVFAHYFLRDERMSVLKVTGVLTGIAGVVVIIGAGVLRGASPALLGELALLLAAMSMAMAAVFGRSLAGVSPLLSATGQAAWTTLFLLPFALVTDRPWLLPMPGTVTWLSVAGIALGGTALGYTIYYRLLATSGATNLL
ncbi:MAG: DMT family transporter, partial [Betaproteobacteria bacterium]|nr:DMT family transporter [Betaproteobacteria bacterium]